MKFTRYTYSSTRYNGAAALPYSVFVRHPLKRILVKGRGFTMIELLITIAIVAILAGTAVPSFTKLISSNQVTIQTNEIFHSLYLARSYAISKQKNVLVCHLEAPKVQKCSNDRNYRSKWSNGWLVFADNNLNNELDDKDEIIRVTNQPDSVNIVFNQRGRLRFFPTGSSRSAGFYLCDRDQLNFRHVYLLHTGRARVNQKLSKKQRDICKAAYTQT